MLNTKKCYCCKIEKPLSQFNKRTKSKDGFDWWCKKCSCIKQKEYRHNHPLKIKEIDRTKHLKKRYGITTVDYNKMFEKQQGCCAICGKHQSELDNRLNVDHNHLTNKIRGLLCFSCNNKLKYIEDIKFVLKAEEYLNEYNSF